MCGDVAPPAVAVESNLVPKPIRSWHAAQDPQEGGMAHASCTGSAYLLGVGPVADHFELRARVEHAVQVDLPRRRSRCARVQRCGGGLGKDLALLWISTPRDTPRAARVKHVYVWRLVLDEARGRLQVSIDPHPFAVEQASCRRPTRDVPREPAEKMVTRECRLVMIDLFKHGARQWTIQWVQAIHLTKWALSPIQMPWALRAYGRSRGSSRGQNERGDRTCP